MIGNTEWPNILADLKAKRDALTQVIATIETHFVPVNGEMPESPLPMRAKGTARRILKRNGAVARVKPATPPGLRAASSDLRATAILAALKENSPQSPMQLAKRLAYETTSALMYHVTKLKKAKRLEVVGPPNNRRIGLPGKTAARGHL